MLHPSDTNQIQSPLGVAGASGATSSWQSLDLSGVPVKELLRRGNLRVEKCELKEAGLFFELALDRAKQNRDIRGVSDSLAQLLRYSSEIGDESAIQKWTNELEIFLAQAAGGALTPSVWYCRGIVAFRSAQYKKAQVLFHRFWREIEKEENEGAASVSSEGQSSGASATALSVHQEFMRMKAQALLALALVAHAQGKTQRARYFGEVILAYAERERPRSILSSTYLMLCRIAERSGDTPAAKAWLQKAFAESVSEHNWYHYMYVLYGFARIARMDQDFIQARFYLDLLEKAVVQDEFKNFRAEIAEERVKLNLNRVDLEIDLNRGVIRTREGEINLRRQHLLIDILHQLALAHDEKSQGLSKQEIIEKVWKETYEPEAHDGKLYYNINRIRKVIEQDSKHPQYLLNWRQGYRLAPEIRIRLIEGENWA
ncbi:MAG: winged helix-turn-helix domain-containing protein [Bdellovibrionales bacterium]|nr:winged helix-turn-helix domain-containing protein [Bdellovibrionales bacterium]